MATTQEPVDGIAGIGKQLAEDAQRLVKAEIAVAIARVKELVVGVALGAGLILAALLMLGLWLIFVLGTLNEGVHALDSWPLYAGVGGLLLGSGALMVGSATPRWFSWLPTLVGVLGLLVGVAGFVLFHVLAIIGGGDELGRRGWAITATVFFVLMVGCAAAGGLTLKGSFGKIGSTMDDFKEEAEWARQLTKRNASGS